MKEQDEVIIITVLCGLVGKLARLYQIQNWTQQNSLELADWIYDNYKFEMFSTIYEVLKNPPPSEGKAWRLTPDTIREWVAPTLEKVAVQREHWHQNKSAPMCIEPVEGLEKQYEQIRARRLQEWELEEEKRKIYKEKRQVQLAKWKATYTVDVLSIEDECKKRDEEYLRQTGQLQSSPSDQKQQTNNGK